MKNRLVFVLMLSMVSPGFTANCRQSQELFKKLTEDLRSVRDEATTAFLNCAQKGPDENSALAVRNHSQSIFDRYHMTTDLVNQECFETKA